MLPEPSSRTRFLAVTRAKDHLIVSWSRAVAFADAQANGIRIGQVITEAGQPVAGKTLEQKLGQKHLHIPLSYDYDEIKAGLGRLALSLRKLQQ